MIGELGEYLKDFDITMPFTFNRKSTQKSTITLPDIRQTLNINRNSDSRLPNLNNLKSQSMFHKECKDLYSCYLEYFVKLLVKFKHPRLKAEEECKLESLGKRIICRIKELLKKYVSVVVNGRI